MLYTETNIILYVNYISIKNKFFSKYTNNKLNSLMNDYVFSQLLIVCTDIQNYFDFS